MTYIEVIGWAVLKGKILKLFLTDLMENSTIWPWIYWTGFGHEKESTLFTLFWTTLLINVALVYLCKYVLFVFGLKVSLPLKTASVSPGDRLFKNRKQIFLL